MTTPTPHEHDFVTQLGDANRPASYGACTVCNALPPAICAVCLKPTPNTIPIHDACLEREREVLAAIASVIAVWPEPIREILTAVAYDLTGVMSVDDKTRLPFGLDQVTDDWAQRAAGIRTTSGALEVLTSWRDAWVVAGAGTDDRGVIDYLRSRIVWAATNPERAGFDDYRTEARTVLARLRHINGDTTETVEGAHCLTCEGPLARERAAGVLDSLAVCQRCGLAYDVAAVGRALTARISTVPDQAPSALVTEPEARRIFAELAPGTIRKWIERGRLTSAGTRRGSAVYRVGDIAALGRPRHAAPASGDAVAG